MEEKHNINDVIPLTFLWHTADFMLHLDQLQQAHQLYAHKAVDTQIRARQNTNKTKTKPSPKSTQIAIKDTSESATGTTYCPCHDRNYADYSDKQARKSRFENTF